MNGMTDYESIVDGYDLKEQFPRVMDESNHMASENVYNFFAVKMRQWSVSFFIMMEEMQDMASHPQFGIIFAAVKNFVSKVGPLEVLQPNGERAVDATDQILKAHFSKRELELLAEVGLVDAPYLGKSTILTEYIFKTYARVFELCNSPEDFKELLRYGTLLADTWHPNNFRRSETVSEGDRIVEA